MSRGEWGTNLSRVKDFNEVVVLDMIRSGGPIGRPAIAAATGLTLQTVSNITRRLLAAEAVVEEEASGLGDGRQRRRLRVNPDAAYAVGIHLVRDAVAAGVVDLAGDIRGRAVRPLGHDDAPETAMQWVADAVGEALAAAGVPRERVLGAGIGVPGPLDLRRGTLLDILPPASWSHFGMRDAVAEAVGMRVIMDNDATGAALGERWRGLGARCDNLIYVYLGTGVGAGLILGGQAYRGRCGNAGEISHIQVDPHGPPCDCGGGGCLGLYVCADGLLREGRRAVLEAPPRRPLPPCPDSVEELLASAEPHLRGVVARAGDHLGRVVANLSRALDPELIVLGGPLAAGVGSRYAAAVARRLEEGAGQGTAPRVELSEIGSDAGVLGAATLVLHDVYAPAARKLSLAEPPPAREAVGG